ncbi:MAG: metallophosphoesterase family protein, partial [Chloroflexota bacterium]|nr:metallophosphoesterase family protein [Chloroflexota bacterium]
YTGLSVVEEFQKQSKRFVGVYGNTDSGRIRDSLPTQQIFEVYGKRIAVLHPHDGGDPEGLELHLSAMFEGVDVILFGHSHEPYLKHGPPILLNPGQGYSQFLTPATLGILHITEERIQAEIVTLE